MPSNEVRPDVPGMADFNALKARVDSLEAQLQTLTWPGGFINPRLHPNLGYQSLLVLISDHVQGSGRNWEQLSGVPISDKQTQNQLLHLTDVASLLSTAPTAATRPPSWVV